MTDNRTEALEWAMESKSDTTLAVVHALLYVGDVLADINLELAAQREARPALEPESKLAKLLKQPSPLAGEQPVNGHGNSESGPDDGKGEYGARFKPRHDPADWTKLPDGRWQSPTGRRYQAWTRQAFGVVTARRKLGLPI